MLFKQTSQRGDDCHPHVKRRVVCADGTGLLTADSQANQAVWPQQSSQTPGCGLPQLRLCGLFNLHTGLALSYRIGSKRSHEPRLLRDQEPSFKHGDIFVGDKGFICYYDQARLLAQGVDSIVALAKRKPVAASKADRCFDANDLLISLPKATSQVAISRYPKERWDSLPQKRWRIERYFRDMKTTLGMELLQGKTPDMVEKQIQMFFIAYNLIRLLILESDMANEPNALAFKSCVQTLLAYNQSRHQFQPRSIRYVLQQLYEHIGQCTLLSRPHRIEPRVVKQRSKPFKLMMKPRAELRAEMMA